MFVMIEYYKQYIKVTRNVSDNTVKHYVTAINTINALLNKYDFPIKNIFSVISIEELDSIKVFLLGNEEFVKKDTVGNRMYSVAFNHFYKFACEDKDFYCKNLEKMDIVIPKKNLVISKSWKRNKIIAAQSLEFANYTCECNISHETFVSASNGRPYMEGHHLIPIKFQENFDVSLDVYANIICLCPICHRMLHYGLHSERKYAADKLFENRKERLLHSGIDISRSEFDQLVI